MRALLFAATLLVATGAEAKSTGVVEDPSVQSGPCYDALVDKNAATPTTAPNRELGAACQAEHGDVDKAWARVIRLWGSDSTDIPDYDSYRPADAPLDGTPPRWLAWAGLVLIYAVLGTPMRSAARLTGARPGPVSGALAGVVLCLIARALIAAMFGALIGLPYLTAACGVVLIAWLMVASRVSAPQSASSSRDGAASALAVHLAELINDGLGAAAGLAALALFVQHNAVLFAIGLALALVASMGPVIAGRRALLATRLGAAAGPALLAAAIGEVLILAPPFATWIGGLTGATTLAPLVLAALTFAAGWRWPPPVKPADLHERTIEGGSG